MKLNKRNIIISVNSFLDEASLSYGGSDHELIEELIGVPLKLTGHISLADYYTAELNGPYESGEEGHSWITVYYYRPNGDYRFAIRSYELLNT